MSNKPTYEKILAHISCALIPTIFCAIVCISTAFTHALDGWLLPCGIYMVFTAILELISVILSAVVAYVNS